MQTRIGDRLRECRHAAKLSLSDVAKEMGVSRQAVSAWEHGRNLCDSMQLATLATLYGASADYILFGINTMPAMLNRAMGRNNAPAS